MTCKWKGVWIASQPPFIIYKKMIDSLWRICMNWEPIVVWKDWYLYLESFLKSQGKEKKQKNRYLDHVFLTTEEYDKLVQSYGEWPTKNLIQDLDIWLSNTKKIRTDHYKTILGFARKWWAKKISNLAKEVVEYDKSNNFTPEQRAIAMEKLQRARDKVLWRI